MAQYRKEQLVNGEIYHVYTRSIAKYIVFNDKEEYERLLSLLNCYHYSNFTHKYSQFSNLDNSTQNAVLQRLEHENDLLVRIIGYCIMPTHLHLILQQITDVGISKFISKVLNGYTKFFNSKHNGVGPLWSGRFKSMIVSTDEQLMHLTRYIHLNPTTANLIKKPEQWSYSSYNEFLQNEDAPSMCDFSDLMKTTPKEYKKFVNNNKQYQKQLSKIKSLIIENYTG